MNTLNQTPFGFATVVGRMSYPAHSVTLIVKGAFDLHAGGLATLAEDQPTPAGDEYFPGDEEQTGAPRYESDFAHFKPAADLLLVGACHAPDGHPTRECRATFGVGATERSLLVSGDRRWDPKQRRPTLTAPERFTEMELRYENSFGGEGFEPNPVGKGYLDNPKQAVKLGLALPNIRDERARIERPGSPLEPVTFGPLSRRWEQRFSKMGSYEPPWLKTRWPWFPEDFDWTHFNAAPEAMQVPGYLRGDEEVYLENLHPERAEYRSRLPGLRVRCFLNQADDPRSDEAASGFREVSMKLDTLWIDAEEEKLILVWRGHAEVLSEDHEELKYVFIVSEALKEPAASLEACRQQFVQAWIEDEGEEDEDDEDDSEEVPEVEPAAASEAAQEIESPASPDAATDAGEAEIDYDAEHEKARVQLRQAYEKAGIDPDNPPELGPKEKKIQARFLKAIGFTDADMGEAGIAPGDVPASNPAELKELALLREKLGIPEQPAAEAPEEGGDTGQDPEEPGEWTRERVEQRVARGEGFAGDDLSELDLSGLDLKGVDFTGAVLAGAVLKGAVLDGARMKDADLSGANLTGASMKAVDLQHADLTAAHLAGADLSDAVLNDAVFESARLETAVLARVTANDADFTEADLTGANLDGSTLDGADFSASTLERASFRRASLKEAFVEGASGTGVIMDRADLTELRAAEGTDFTRGSFREVIAPDSIWHEAKLDGADFSYARMEEADFTRASLVGAEFFAADMRAARLTRANLRGAHLVEMNLFEGSLAKASLVDADLSGSNMYGADFVDADITGIRTADTNLVMTKLTWS